MDQNWTLITRRRRHRRHHPPSQSQSETLTLTLNPSPFTPSGFSNPHQESHLLLQIQSSINQLTNSPFLLRFLSQIQQPLQNLQSSKTPHMDLVAYGIGSLQSSKTPRLQLALALLLHRHLAPISAGPVQVFDPALSVVDCNVLAALGCNLIPVNEFARRAAAVPTIFYMPHCEAGLYDNLLGANWDAAMLRRMAVIGNSFGAYERNAREMRGACGCVDMERDGRHLIGVRRFVREVEIEEESGDAEFYMAFHGMSWHFFEIDDDADLGGSL